MTKRKRTIEIVIESQQVFVIRKLDNSSPQRCALCGEKAQMVSVDEEASILRVAPRAIYQQVESQHAHFMETPDRKLLVCLRTLLQSSQE